MVIICWKMLEIKNLTCLCLSRNKLLKRMSLDWDVFCGEKNQMQADLSGLAFTCPETPLVMIRS